jgi:ATP-binding cassette subfamily B protein RaxB
LKTKQWIIDDVVVTGDTSLLMILVSGTHMNLQWSANVFSHLMSLPISHFEKRNLGDVLSRFGAVKDLS